MKLSVISKERIGIVFPLFSAKLKKLNSTFGQFRWFHTFLMMEFGNLFLHTMSKESGKNNWM